MNFFQRRRIFKNANFLDLTPVRKLDHEVRSDGNITLLMPRFKKRVTSALFQPASKGLYIHIKLDRFGSHAWLLADGQSTVGDICDKLKNLFPEDLGPVGETDDRVTKFMALLYQERYITFREIEEGNDRKEE